MTNEELIKQEDWKKAEGVVFTGTETNAGLTQRDYSIKCKIPHLIALIEGYHIWWCSTHHQPHSWCENGKLDQLINNNCLVLLDKD